MFTVINSLFDIEGTQYDIIYYHDFNIYAVVRDDIQLFRGSLQDSNNFAYYLIMGLNQLYKP